VQANEQSCEIDRNIALPFDSKRLVGADGEGRLCMIMKDAR
jgi:hypothetical protein